VGSSEEGREDAKKSRLRIAALLAAPVALWNASNGWVSFRFQTLDRLGGDYHLSLQDLLGGLLVLLTPVGMLAAALAIRNRAAAVGARGNHAVPERAARLLLCSVLLPLAVFSAFSLFRLVKLNWTAPLWLGLLPFMAAPALPRLPLFAPPVPVAPFSGISVPRGTGHDRCEPLLQGQACL